MERRQVGCLLIQTANLYLMLKLALLKATRNSLTRNACQKTAASISQSKIQKVMAFAVIGKRDPIPAHTTALRWLTSETVELLQQIS
eukprot:15364589-Ditylum_brightwellii.AAC.3